MNLKQMRIEHNLTLQSVADIIGVSKSTVFKWEQYKINISGDNLFKIADLYNISPELLVSNKKNTGKYNKFPYRSVPLIKMYNNCNILDLVDDGINNTKIQKIICPVRCSEKTFASEQNGASMQSLNVNIKPGTILFSDPMCDFKNGDIVLAMLSNGEYVCSQYINEYNKKMLMPSNNLYPVVKKDFNMVAKVIATLNIE